MENKIIKAGTKIFVDCHTGYAGMDSYEGYILTEDTSEEDLDRFAWERAINNAESYGIYHRGDYLDDIDEEDSDSDSYSANIEGYWELYDEKKHAAKITYNTEPVFDKF